MSPATLNKSSASNVATHLLASFPGLSRFLFFSLCSVQYMKAEEREKRGRPGLIHHVSDHKVDIGRRDPTTKQCTGSLVQALYRSSGLKMLAWSKLLVFTGKKLTLRVYSYILEYRPLPLTSFSRPPRVHLMSFT